MTINLHIPSKIEHLRPTITVIGVGGAGGNAVNNMIASKLEGVNFVVANTDAQALDHSLTERTIQLGAGITKGLGAGANPAVGRDAAEEAKDEIAAYIEGSNMVFITAGMGGGTGTGAASVVARIAKDLGVLTVAVVTKPFQFEGKHRMNLAEEGLKELQEYVDTLIVIPNQNLFRVANEKTTFADAFKMADEVLHSGVRGVTDLMVKPGLINLDFSDIRTVMREMGKAMMGTGESTGERRAVESAESAISNPLLDDVSLKGARALLVNVTGGYDMTLFEVDEALNRIREEVDPEANIIFGSTFNDNMEGKMRVSVVATGIDHIQGTSSGNHKNTNASDTKKPFSYTPANKSDPIKAAPRAAYNEYNNSRDYTPQPIHRPSIEQRLGGAVRFEKPAESYFSSSHNQAENTQEAGTSQQASAEQYIAPSVPNVSAILHEQREQQASIVEVQPAPEFKQEFKTEDKQEVKQEPKMFKPHPGVVLTPVPAPQAQSPAPIVRRELDEEEAHDSGKGFFKRIADAGRALSSRNEMTKDVAEPRVQVVHKSSDSSDRASKPQDQDQYLDIPAFLRRQAN